MGPGTNIVTRLYNNILPVNRNDAVTLLHDLDYISTLDPIIADDKAISELDYTISGIAGKLGLTLRKYTGVKFNQPLDIYPVLKQYVKKHPQYALLFKHYKLNID